MILDKYFKYNQDVYKNINNLKDKINNSKDLENLSKELESLEKDITMFHVKAVDEVIKESKSNIDFVGFHGQTIFHSAKEKISNNWEMESFFLDLQKRLLFIILEKMT